MLLKPAIWVLFLLVAQPRQMSDAESLSQNWKFCAASFSCGQARSHHEYLRHVKFHGAFDFCWDCYRANVFWASNLWFVGSNRDQEGFQIGARPCKWLKASMSCLRNVKSGGFWCEVALAGDESQAAVLKWVGCPNTCHVAAIACLEPASTSFVSPVRVHFGFKFLGT